MVPIRYQSMADAPLYMTPQNRPLTARPVQKDHGSQAAVAGANCKREAQGRPFSRAYHFHGSNNNENGYGGGLEESQSRTLLLREDELALLYSPEDGLHDQRQPSNES